MSFENWEKFLHDTIEELNNDSNIEERMNTERTGSQQRRKTRRGESSPEVKGESCAPAPYGVNAFST